MSKQTSVSEVMTLYVTGNAYNVVGFDEPPEIIAEPVVIGTTQVQPGDRLTAIPSGGRTSAAFGSFEMVRGFITYLGKYNHVDERGDHVYILFDYDFPRNLFGEANGHKYIFVAWILLSDGSLFYEIRRNGRLIVPGELRFYTEQEG